MNIEQREYIVTRLQEMHLKAAESIAQANWVKYNKYRAASRPSMQRIHAAIKSGEVKLRPSTKVDAPLIESFYNLDALNAQALKEQAAMEQPVHIANMGSLIGLHIVPEHSQIFEVHYPEFETRMLALAHNLKRLTDIAMLGDLKMIEDINLSEPLEF